jgi:hypothetical protein
LGVLESRELLSALPLVPSPAAIHVEKGSGKGPSGTTGSSVGSLEGTVSLSYVFGLGFSASTFAQGPVAQYGEFTTGTGSGKPFGRVRIVANSSYIQGAGFYTMDLLSHAYTPPPSSLEGPTFGVINLANTRGRSIGSITLQGDSWGQFEFTDHRSGSKVVASGTGNLAFPEGEPTLTYNSGDGNGPAMTVPFTITL